MRMRQLWTYPGSKAKRAAQYVRHFPAKFVIYVSLFAGTAMDIALKKPSRIEVCNDTSDRIFDVFQVLQIPTECEQLLRLADNTPNSRRQFEVCCRILRDPPKKHSRVVRAWAFLVVGASCKGGLNPSLTKHWIAASGTRDDAARKLATLPDRIREWRDRFRRVRLEHADWCWVFDKYDGPRTFTFADPPYFPLTRKSKRLYEEELTVEMHVKLLRKLSAAKGCVMLCGYNHPLYTGYLFHWNKVEFDVKATIGPEHTPRCEVIWMNYEPDGSKIGKNKMLIARRYVEILGGGTVAQKYLDRINSLMGFSQPSDAGPAPWLQRVWLNYTDDGRKLPMTRLLIAKRYVELMGSPCAAQRYLDRIMTLLSLTK